MGPTLQGPPSLTFQAPATVSLASAQLLSHKMPSPRASHVGSGGFRPAGHLLILKETLTLPEGRLQVRCVWRAGDGGSGHADPAFLSGTSGLGLKRQASHSQCSFSHSWDAAGAGMTKGCGHSCWAWTRLARKG